MAKIQIRRDTADFWEGANPVLAEGELGLELGSFKFKVGDGTKAWNDLDYIFVDAEIPTDVLKSGDNVSELVNDAGYLTTGLQSGDNISELTNDVGYVTNGLQSGDNISELTNDVGYLVTALQPGDNVSRLFNDAGYLNRAEVNQIVDDGGFLTDALQSGDNVSELVNDAGYLTTGLQSGDNVSELVNDAGYLIDSDVDQILTDGGYLTTALQPGDNVSDLNNDAGYLTTGLQSGDNVSELTNDAGYLTTGLQSGDNVSELINDVNYLTTSSSIGDLGDVTMDNIPPTGHYLKWDGVSWVSAPGPVTEGEAVGIELTDLSAATVEPGVTSLTYNDVSGVFTYTPPDLSAYLTSYSEIDPIFTASPASGISEDDITNWNTAYGWGDHASAGYWIDDPLSRSNWDTAYNWGDHSTEGYLTSFSETDPIFTMSPASGISGDDITNWNTAYGWGDHSTEGYLTSFVETDPVFTASPAFGILTSEIDNWNIAYGWGDHSAQGYLTSEADTLDTVVARGNSTGADVEFGTNKAIFGGSAAFEIYHDGVNGYIDNATGELYIRDVNASGTNRIFIQPKTDENSIVAYEDGQVELYHDGGKKLETTSTGVTITSTLTAQNLDADSLTVGSLTYPSVDGNAGDQLVTDGNGGLTFTDTARRIHCDIRNYYTGDWADAFNDCADANGVVYFPEGEYLISGVISRINQSIRVYGDGSGQSIITFIDGGFNFIGSQTVEDYDTIILENIGITGSGTNAVRIEYYNNGGVTQKAYCNDVAVTGIWETGFHLANTDLSTFENCSVYRPVGYNGVGVEVTVDDSAQGGTDPVNIRFNNWQIAGLDTAFKVNSQSEGIYIHDNLIIACKNGISLDGNVNDNEAAEPYYIIRGNNIDVWKNCIRMDGLMQCVITDNSFYKFQSGPADENWKGIIIEGNSYDNIITDNIFNGNIIDPSSDSSNYWGVHIKRSVGSTFSNNTFLSLDLGFKLDETSQNSFNRFVDNTYRVVTEHFNTFNSGNSLAEEMMTRGNLLTERIENNRYNMINGDGFYVYDSNNISGFRIGPNTREALQALRTAAAAATDFDSLKAAIVTTLADI